jgi:hypothetical protein
MAGSKDPAVFAFFWDDVGKFLNGECNSPPFARTTTRGLCGWPVEIPPNPAITAMVGTSKKPGSGAPIVAILARKQVFVSCGRVF